MGLHIIIVGNPVDGFTHYGPFKTSDDAIAFAEKWVDDTWWVAQLFHKDDLK